MMLRKKKLLIIHIANFVQKKSELEDFNVSVNIPIVKRIDCLSHMIANLISNKKKEIN